MLSNALAQLEWISSALTTAEPPLPTMLEVLLGTALVLCFAGLFFLGSWLAGSRRVMRRNRVGRTASLKASGMANWEWDPARDEILVLGDFFGIMGGQAVAPPTQTHDSVLSRKQFIELVHPDDRQYFSSALASALEHNQDLQTEHRILMDDNSVRYVAHSGGPVNLPGERGRFFAVVRDVTAKRSYARKLELSRERFVALFKGLPLSAAIWQRTGDRITLYEISDEADLLTQSGLRLYLGRPLSEAAKSLPPEYVVNVKKCFESGGALHTEAPQAFGDMGSYRHLLSHFKYLPPDMVAVYSIDLTARKRTEEALKENEKRLRTLGDNLPGGALFQAERAEGNPVRITYASGGLFRLMGRSHEEMASRAIEELPFVHPEDLPRLLLTIDASARTMTLLDQEVRLFGQNRETFWLRMCASPREAGPTRTVWDGYFFDISRLKHIESALRDSEARLRTLGDNLPGGVIYQLVQNAEGELHVPYISAGFKDLTGRLPENAMANPAEAFAAIHPDDLPGIVRSLEKSAADLTVMDEEIRVFHTDGRMLWTRARAVPRHMDRDNKIWDGFMIDITQSKRDQIELRTVLEDSPAPIVRVQTSDNGPNLISYLNPAAKQLFGEHALGKPCRDYICGGDQCSAQNASEGRLENMPCTLRCLDGNRQAVRNVQLTEDGHVIEVFMDLTDQIKAQQAMREARDTARAASRIKDEFLANMSHEIRTPLNGVMGMLNLALDSDLTPEVRSLLQTAVDSSRSLLGVINDILDITRIEAGKMDIQTAPFHLGDTVSALMENFSNQAMEQDVELTSHIDPALPPVMNGDRSRLLQILFNLVGNALKFTKHGSVSLEAWKVGEGKTLGSLRVLFIVSDTGVGIPDDKLEHVFQAFTQADGSLSRRYGGAGLGLGIVRRLATLMSGSLAVTSEPGKGTAVHVSLELGQARSETVEKVRAKPGGQARTGARILVAEDNPVNRILAVKLLEKLGCVVDDVEDGTEAVEALRTSVYDAVLMDVQMPGTNGVVATRLIREDESGDFDSDIPIIAITAHAMKGDRERFLEAGMTDYVSKPLDKNDLAEVLARHIPDLPGRSGPAGH